MSKNALYNVVYDTLKREISDGIFKPGTFLPTEKELCDRFQVSRTTIRKVISLLRDEGQVEVKQGRGTTIMDVTTTQKLSRISSITETLTSEGHVVTVQGMSITKIETPEYLQAYFSAQEPLFCLERIMCSDGVPISYSTTYLLASMVPNFDRYVNKFVGLYGFLESKYNIRMTEAVETLSAAGARFAEAQMLDIPCGAPLLISKRLTKVDNVLFEYGINRLVGDRYKYSIYLSGR